MLDFERQPKPKFWGPRGPLVGMEKSKKSIFFFQNFSLKKDLIFISQKTLFSTNWQQAQTRSVGISCGKLFLSSLKPPPLGEPHFPRERVPQGNSPGNRFRDPSRELASL